MIGRADLPEEQLLAELGRRIAARRVHVDLTQADLAAQAGVAKRSLERLERGRPTELRTLLRVLRALGIAGGLDVLVPPAPDSSRRRAVRPHAADRR